jgi:uncharacterized protein (DUF1499 family)
MSNPHALLPRPKSMATTALAMMEENPVAIAWAAQLANNPNCFSADALDNQDPEHPICFSHEHGVSFNEISKLHAMPV